MKDFAIAFTVLAVVWFALFLTLTLRKEPPVNPRSRDYDPTLFP